jgi:protein-tyrosine-phosphatase
MANDIKLYNELEAYVEKRVAEFDQIPDERKKALEQLATFVQKQQKASQETKLVFICTHNSRRSHMSQIWAQTAAWFYGIPQVQTYSGGTEATAFNPRAVEALERAGFRIEKETDGRNPIYNVKFYDEARPMKAFSKVYSEATNPTTDFCAVMTCSQADKSCPSVEGASKRLAIPYDDPKAFDDTPQETRKYDERCQQIAREMLYLFSYVGTRT